MITDALVIGALLSGCLGFTIAAFKKFQPEIEKGLKNSESLETLKIKN